jgi:hypothetical protein
MPYAKVYVTRRHRVPCKEIFVSYIINLVSLFNLFCIDFITPVFITHSDIILSKNLLLHFLSNRSAWRQTVHFSLLLQFSVSRGPRVLVQCTTVNIRFFLTVFKEGFENIFFHFADIYHIQKTTLCLLHVENYTWSLSWREVTRDKTVYLYFKFMPVIGYNCRKTLYSPPRPSWCNGPYWAWAHTLTRLHLHTQTYHTR